MDDEKVPQIPQLSRLTSVELSEHWIEMDEDEMVPEYRQVLKLSCIKKEHFAQSGYNHILEYLDGRMNLEPLEENSFPDLLTRCIAKAYADAADPLQVSCMIWGGNVYSKSMKVYDAFTWRKGYFHCALRELENELDDGQLLGLLADFARSGGMCLGRKRFSFNLCLQLVEAMLNDEEEQEVAEIAAEMHPALHAQRLLLDYVQAYLVNYKTNAYNAAVIETARVYFGGVKSGAVDTIEMHGGSCYGTVVMACLGIQVPIAWMDDHQISGSLVQYLECEMKEYQEAIELLLLPENLGKGFKEIPECRALMGNIPKEHKLKTSSFYFPGKTPRDKALAALDPSEENAEKRAKLVPYLTRFMQFFRAEVVLSRLANVINQERSREAQVVFEALKERDGDIEEEDYRFWLWDLMDGTFHLDRAVRFFDFMGIIRDDFSLE